MNDFTDFDCIMSFVDLWMQNNYNLIHYGVIAKKLIFEYFTLKTKVKNIEDLAKIRWSYISSGIEIACQDQEKLRIR